MFQFSKKEKYPKLILFGLILLFIGYYVFLSFARHDNFYSRRLDLGNMDQTVWNVLHGNGFTLTDPMGDHQESRLAVHGDFLLILLAPLYVLWSDPKMLLLLQVVITGIGAIPVYWIAREKLKSPWLAVLFAGAYLLYPPLNRKMLHDFHAVALSTTFLLFAFWYMEKKRYLLFTLFAVLAGLGKEHVWLITGLMGLNILLFHKKYLLGSAVLLVSAAIFIFLFWYAIPSVTPMKQHFALVYLSEFGDNQNSILKNILLNPWQVIRLFFLPDRLYYYFQILVPLGFLSLFSPLTLIYAMPSVLINSLSNNQLMRQIDYQYNSTVTSFIVISAIYGYTHITSCISELFSPVPVKKRKYVLPGYLLAAVLVCTYLWGELPVGKSTWFWFFTTPLPEKKNMQRIAGQIGPRYSVSVTNNIGAHFSQRKELYNFPIKSESADYSVIYLGDPYAWPSGEAQNEALKRLTENPEYEQIASESGFYAFRKK